jgi:hypothetical protein
MRALRREEGSRGWIQTLAVINDRKLPLGRQSNAESVIGVT